MKLLLAVSLIVLQYATRSSARTLRPPTTAHVADTSDTHNQQLTDLLLPLLDQLDDHVHEVEKKRLLEISPLQNSKSKKMPLLILASEIPTRNLKDKFDFIDATDYLLKNDLNKKINERLLKHTLGSPERNHETTRKQNRGRDSIERYNYSDEDVNILPYRLKQHLNKISKSNQLVSNNKRQKNLHKLNDELKDFSEDYSDYLENSGEERELYHNNRNFKQLSVELVNNLPFVKNNKKANDNVKEASNEKVSSYRQGKENVDGTLIDLSKKSKKVDQTTEDRMKNVEKNKDIDVNLELNKNVRSGVRKQDEVNAIEKYHDRKQPAELLNEGQERAENYLFEPNENNKNVPSRDTNTENKLMFLNTNVGEKNKKDSLAEELVQLNEFSNNLSTKTSSELEHTLHEDRTTDSSFDSFEVLKKLTKLHSGNALNKNLLSSNTNRNSKLILQELVDNAQKAVDSDAVLPKVLNLLKDDLSLTTFNVNSKHRAPLAGVSKESLEKKNGGVLDSIESVGSVRNIDAAKRGVDADIDASMEGLFDVVNNIDKNKLSRSIDQCDLSRVGTEDMKGVHKVYNLTFRFRK